MLRYNCHSDVILSVTDNSNCGIWKCSIMVNCSSSNCEAEVAVKWILKYGCDMEDK